MDITVRALQRLAPREMAILKRRYSIVESISLFQPIGRRSLSQKLGVTEKIIRNDIEFLKSEGFILVKSTGMEPTDSGILLLEELKTFIKHLEGLTTIEQKVKRILGCQRLFITSGNADTGSEALINIGKVAAKVLVDELEEDSTIALTGGETVNNVINAIKMTDLSHKNILAVPARGSLGYKVNYQANTLVSMLAEKLNCRYRLLNIPDNLSEKALDSVRQEPDIQKTMEAILKSNILVFGIGTATEMANRRRLEPDEKVYLQHKNAVAEVLGYYFDAEGHIVYTSRSIGIKLEEMTKLEFPLAVAGGASKAKAILAVKDLFEKGCLVIDEGAAAQIIELSQVN
jgi:central glycolytic genes regulator